MALELRVTGSRELRDLAADLRRERTAKRRLVVNAIERGARVLRRTIPASALATLPSGYGPTMARSVRVTGSVQVARGAVSIRVRAMGKVDERDVASIDGGILRHPVFGDRSEGHWRNTRVRPGFATRPFADAKGPITDEVDQALNGIVDRIERG